LPQSPRAHPESAADLQRPEPASAQIRSTSRALPPNLLHEFDGLLRPPGSTADIAR
jgi:hypothetical protein